MIGVVAVLTLPALINNVKSKVNEAKQEVFRARLLNGLKETAVQSSLMGYDTTMEFAKALGQHYKMFNVCDTNNISACYNVGEVVINENGNTLNIEDIDSAEYLNLDVNKYLPPVTIVSPDGTLFIMSYKKDCSITESEINGIIGKDVSEHSSSEVALSCIDGVVDLNGLSKPNTQGKDIKSLRQASLSNSIWTTITDSRNGKKIKVSKELIYYDENGDDRNGNWYDAKNGCEAINGKLPDIDTLEQVIYPNKDKLDLIHPNKWFWSSTSTAPKGHEGWTSFINIGSGLRKNDGYKPDYGLWAVCVKN